MTAMIYPYHGGSKSARAIGKETGYKRIRRTNSTFSPQNSRAVIINWGCTRMPEGFSSLPILNRPEDVVRASNKLLMFDYLSPAKLGRNMVECLPEAFFSRQALAGWMFRNPGRKVVARTVLCGHSGKGIVISDDLNSLPHAKLYTEFLDVQTEYRIHLGRVGSKVAVIDATQKKLRRNHPKELVNHDVKAWKNGWIFARQDVNPPEVVTKAAEAVFTVMGLNFAALDVVLTHDGKGKVLEVNTAPGVEGTTVKKYAEFFKEAVPEASEMWWG